ncbi:DUF4124 domain-containing protein [Halomonas sp. YLGW01]|uniref:DUF4124 domain-containing protein n=1 Tax=Halomonas sp. YLGW01 TaxID=2773308 RepID=UPI00178633ED|nr:DUF4124 domain-containing protein [Halomonas sp. YLGW01]
MPMLAGRLCLRLVGLTLAVWTLAVEAQVYSWQDEEGRWHFADAPPAAQEPADDTERRSVDDLPTLNTMQPPQASPYRQPATPPSSGRASHSLSGSREAAPDPRCQRLEERLESVQQALRAGYREPRGNRLRARRRALTDAYRRECRNSQVHP